MDALQELADKAAEHGLIIGLENEHACNIATAQETARVLAAIDHENLKVVWDPANAYVSGEKPFPDGLPAAGRHVVLRTSTLKTARLQTAIKLSGVPLGEGDIDWVGQIDGFEERRLQRLYSPRNALGRARRNKLEGSKICGRNLKKTCRRSPLK